MGSISVNIFLPNVENLLAAQHCPVLCPRPLRAHVKAVHFIDIPSDDDDDEEGTKVGKLVKTYQSIGVQ